MMESTYGTQRRKGLSRNTRRSHPELSFVEQRTPHPARISAQVMRRSFSFDRLVRSERVASARDMRRRANFRAPQNLFLHRKHSRDSLSGNGRVTVAWKSFQTSHVPPLYPYQKTTQGTGNLLLIQNFHFACPSIFHFRNPAGAESRTAERR